MDLRTVIDTRRKGESDVFLFVAVFLLAGMGIALSYSASAVYAMNTFGDSFYFLKRQMLWFAISFMSLLVFQEIDYRLYNRHTKTMLLISIVLLALVLIPGIGHSVKGSARWLGFGPFRLQPSEFVKLFMVIYLVKVFSSEDRGVQPSRILVPIIVIAVMFVLIMLQPDFSTAVDLLVVSVLILSLPVSFLYIWCSCHQHPHVLPSIYQVDYRKDRLLAFINPGRTASASAIINQSFIAFKKGGFLGVGLGYGTQKSRGTPLTRISFFG